MQVCRDKTMTAAEQDLAAPNEREFLLWASSSAELADATGTTARLVNFGSR